MPLPRAARILGACARYIEEQLLAREFTPQWASLDTLADAITSVEYYLERLSAGSSKEENDLLLSVAEESVAALGYAVAKTSRTDIGGADLDAVRSKHSEKIQTTPEAAEADEASLAAAYSSVLQPPAQPEPHEQHTSEPAPFAAATESVPASSTSETVTETIEDATTAAPSQPTLDASEPPSQAAQTAAAHLKPEPSNLLRNQAPSIGNFYPRPETTVIVSPSLQNASWGTTPVKETQPAATLAESPVVAEIPADAADALMLPPETMEELVDAAPAAVKPAAPPVAAAASAAIDDDDAIDEEIIEIFVEEATEVRETIAEYFPRWAENFDDQEALTEFRRAFHTLKGSGRMVGANDIGELAWSIENMLNRVIDKTITAGPPQIAIIEKVRGLLPDMIEAFSQHLPNPHPVLSAQYRGIAEALARGQEVPELVEDIATAREVEAAAPEVQPEQDDQGFQVEEIEAIAAEAPTYEPEHLLVTPVPETAGVDATELDIEYGELPSFDAPQVAEALPIESPTTESPVDNAPVEAARDSSSLHISPIDDDEMGDDAQLWDIFGAEALTHLQVVQDFIALMDAEAPCYEPPSDNIQRALHTLKGSAHMAEITPIAELAAPLEKFVKELRSYHVVINDDILQLLRDAVTYTQTGLTQITEGEAVSIPRLHQFVARVNELRELHVAPLVRQQELDANGQRPVDPELLSIFMAEEMNLLLNADKIIARWRNEPEHVTLLQPVLEELRNLTRGAQHAYLPPMAQLAEKLEHVYVDVIALRLPCNYTVCGTLNAAHLALLDMVDAVAAGQNLADTPTHIHQALDDLLAEATSYSSTPAANDAYVEPEDAAEPEQSPENVASFDTPEELEVVASPIADAYETLADAVDEEIILDLDLDLDYHTTEPTFLAGATTENTHPESDAFASFELEDIDVGGLANDEPAPEALDTADITLDLGDELVLETDEEAVPDQIFTLEDYAAFTELPEGEPSDSEPLGDELFANDERPSNLEEAQEPAILTDIVAPEPVADETAGSIEALADASQAEAPEELLSISDLILEEEDESDISEEITLVEPTADTELVPPQFAMDDTFSLSDEDEEISFDGLTLADETGEIPTLESDDLILEDEDLLLEQAYAEVHADMAQAASDQGNLHEQVAAELSVADRVDELQADESWVESDQEAEPVTLETLVTDLEEEPELVFESSEFEADETFADNDQDEPILETESITDLLLEDEDAEADEQDFLVETLDSELTAPELDLSADEPVLDAGIHAAQAEDYLPEDEALIEDEVADELIAEAPSAAPAITAVKPIEPPPAPVAKARVAVVEDDDFDPEIVEIFIEEANELLEDMERALHEWQEDWNNSDCVEELKRCLHTFKGGARLAGLTELGDLSHNFESVLIDMDSGTDIDQNFFKQLNEFQDRLHSGVAEATAKLNGDLAAAEENYEPETPVSEAGDSTDSEIPAYDTPVHDETNRAPSPDFAQELLRPTLVVDNSERVVGPGNKPNVLTFAPKPKPPSAPLPKIPGSEFGGNRQGNAGNGQVQHLATRRAGPQEVVKVSAELLEELVNLAGETSISRGRMEQQVSDLGSSIEEMDATIHRLQEQLRRLDIETEAQVLFRQEQMAQHEEFDPLEMDRYSQLQQLSRSLIESASDLMDLKYTLADKTRDTETLLLQQSRINTDLQEGLMRSRMVPFSRLVPRLRRIVRQAATELGKEVDFELDNVEGELDRTVLERMVAPLEHMLRNAVDHGIESPEDRLAAGKPGTGRIALSLGREGGDVMLRLADDGRGINLQRVREKAIERGLMAADAPLSDQDLMQFILHAGFSTADKVTQISGRGVGMDVVHSEIKQLGGAMFIDSRWGEGTEFTIRLPFTVSVNRALMIQIGDDLYAIPLNTIEGIVRVSPFELEHYYQEPDARFDYAGDNYLVRYLGTMLDSDAVPKLDGQSLPLPVILVRSTENTVALQVDRLLGSREIVVKTLGAQFGAVRGVSGATVTGDGSVVVILDLHALIREQLALGLNHTMMLEPIQMQAQVEEDQVEKTVMVVDDSVTVRKVTSRFLEREGFRVITAKDGVEALQLLQDHIPDVMLLDIEMPRMDGFEVAKNIRTSSRLRDIPIIMITSRTGEKHRDRAFELGVNKYMGKPYQEDLLLSNIQELIGKPGK